MRSTVLVTDDEPHILDVVRAYLERDGYAVLAASDGEHALALARSGRPDLLVLDVMLPDMSGFDILRAVRREAPATAVVMLTARDDVIDRVAGLELGADDYVVKPFEPRELVARVGAVLRRLGRAAESAENPGDQTGPGEARPGEARPGEARPGEVGPAPEPGRGLLLGGLWIDFDQREVIRGSERIALTRTEFDLLVALAERPGRVWTRAQIGERVFGESFDSYDRTIDSHVSNLRRKLGVRPDERQYVETVRGIGYRAAADVHAAAGSRSLALASSITRGGVR